MHRLLSSLDRNPLSTTFGSFDRAYWHDKTSDFSDMDHQFGVLALALVYKHDFPENPFKGQRTILDWAIAAMDFWASRQHRDGSFDEHYPFEHGWVGPTGFSAYACAEAYQLLKDEIPPAAAKRICKTIRQAARYLTHGQAEDDHLANHHAMACLAVWKAYEVLGDPNLVRGYERLWKGFLSYHNNDEGWSREYDGPDPGYLSATVSFLAKLYQCNPDPSVFRILDQSIQFCSYFVYPDGFYAGSVGSRNTRHFYPHGFEVMAKQIPLAASISEKMLSSLEQGKLVPPEIMPDRYMAYRLPEYLLSYRDYAQRPAEWPALPYEQKPFTRYFPQAGIHVVNREASYTVASLAKGGVLKLFDRTTGNLLINDAGFLAQLVSGELVSSQWVDPTYQISIDQNGWEVAGCLHVIPANKRFTPLTFFLFRATLLVLGWSPRLCHWLKRWIRRVIILRSGVVPIRFLRRCTFGNRGISLSDTLRLEKDHRIAHMTLGADFMTRHVPQSQYFQLYELESSSSVLSAEELIQLNKERHMVVERHFNG